MDLIPRIQGITILDEDGMRLCSKYYDKKAFPTQESEKEFEMKVAKKTKGLPTRSESECIMIDKHTIVFRQGANLACHVIGSTSENELILATVLEALFDTLSVLLRGHLDRRTLFENLALVFLTIDELIDGGMILETDPMAIANRVLMKGAEAGQSTEFNFSAALVAAREELLKRMAN